MKVLIIPGGGVFGIVPSRFLSEINGSLRRVDVFGGTSIGGILSLMYASGGHPLEVHSNFQGMMDEVFQRPLWSRLVPGPKYTGEALERSLRRLLPAKLADVPGKVVVPTMDFTASRPKVFDNLSGRDADVETWLVGRATSAAPTYFPPADFRGHALIDGGLLENVPVLTTCSAIQTWLGVPFGEQDVFVIGTGRRGIDPSSRRWSKVKSLGLVGWARPLAALLTEGNEMGSAFWGRTLGLKGFRFFDPVVLDEGWDMDCPADGRKAEKRAGDYVRQFRQAFDEWLQA